MLDLNVIVIEANRLANRIEMMFISFSCLQHL